VVCVVCGQKNLGSTDPTDITDYKQHHPTGRSQHGPFVWFVWFVGEFSLRTRRSHGATAKPSPACPIPPERI